MEEEDNTAPEWVNDVNDWLDQFRPAGTTESFSSLDPDDAPPVPYQAPGGLHRPARLGGGKVLQFEKISRKEKRKRQKYKAAFNAASRAYHAAGGTGRPPADWIDAELAKTTKGKKAGKGGKNNQIGEIISDEDLAFYLKIGAIGIGVYFLIKTIGGV